MDFIEACYQRRDNLAEWAQGLLCQAIKLHGRQVGAGAYFYRVGSEGRVDISQLFSAPGSDLAHDPHVGPLKFVEFINGSPLRGAIVPATFGSDRSFLLLSDLPEELREPLCRALPPGAGDSMCMRGVSHVDGFHMCVLGASRFGMTGRRRRYLNRLSRHVSAGYRLQRTFAAARLDADLVLGVASGDGRVLHATGRFRKRQAADTFIARVKAMDRSRCRRIKQAPEEADRLWEAFADGEYSLVESLDSDGKRLILAVRTAAPRGSALTSQERRVIEGVARGHGNKTIGADLGISASTIAVHLQSAMRKLGFRTRQSVVSCLTVRRGGPSDETGRERSGPDTAVSDRNES